MIQENSIPGDVLCVTEKEFILVPGFHGIVALHLHVLAADAVAVHAGESMYLAGNQPLPFTGAQVPLVGGPSCLFHQTDPNTPEADVFQEMSLTAMEENAVLTHTVDILKVDVADLACLGIAVAVNGRHADRFALAPPLVGKAPGTDVQIGKQDIFDVALVPKLERNAPVGIGDRVFRIEGRSSRLNFLAVNSLNACSRLSACLVLKITI